MLENTTIDVQAMKIGQIALDNPLVLAPMAGITQLPLRMLAKEQGCALVVSEMISANGLVYGAGKTMALLRSAPGEQPFSVQIFGKEPAIMRDAAQIVMEQGADIVDINLGCSVKKIVRQEAGVALMRDPRRFRDIVQAVRGVLKAPLTVKIRSGWDATGDQAITIGHIAQDEGVDAIAIHPRTAQQGFGGVADWTLIKRLKKSLSIPVIGNGDVRTARDIVKMFEQTQCDAVMVGRAAMGNPWIFSQALDLLAGRKPETLLLSTRKQGTLRYLEHAVEHFGEFTGVRMMRSRLPWFVKGLPRASSFRNGIVRLESKQAMMEAVEVYFDTFDQSGISM
jgi:nifR3 family TIM-barrel protein